MALIRNADYGLDRLVLPDRLSIYPVHLGHAETQTIQKVV